ncbi:unnamed protein product [Urochloa humidicola]
MDGRLLSAAVAGDARLMKQLGYDDPAVLHGTTPQGNTCLHISSTHGHEGFCKDAIALNRSLLGIANVDGETPLLAAVTSDRVSLASFFLRCLRDEQLCETILKQDKRGCNVLHHAIRRGHRRFALELIEAEPALSKAVNQYEESPLFIAVMRNYPDMSAKLLGIPDSAHGGSSGYNALHAAVRNGNSDIAKNIMETRPGLAKQEDKDKNTPMQLAAICGRIDVLRVLLEHDRSLGYVVSSDNGVPLLVSAAYRGHVGVARELVKHCPDTPYCKTNGWTCLHEAVYNEHAEFVQFVLDAPQFRGLVNMRDSDGDTALHLAVQKCSPKMVAALLLHPAIDVTVLGSNGGQAIWSLSGSTNHAKTLIWNEVSMLMLEADPNNTTSIYNLHKDAKDKDKFVKEGYQVTDSNIHKQHFLSGNPHCYNYLCSCFHLAWRIQW